VVRVIKKQLVKRALDMLKEVAERPALADSKMSDYNTLWESFGKYIKLGALEDSANKCAAGPGPRARPRGPAAPRARMDVRTMPWRGRGGPRSRQLACSNALVTQAMLGACVRAPDAAGRAGAGSRCPSCCASRRPRAARAWPRSRSTRAA